MTRVGGHSSIPGRREEESSLHIYWGKGSFLLSFCIQPQGR